MKKQKYIQLPRGYLSYSQLTLWLADKKKYADLYFDGLDLFRTTNSGQAYGKVVADALEKGTNTGDLVTDSAMLMLTKYDTPDKEIRCDMKTKEGIVPLLIKPDTLDSKTKNFREFKTGKTPWTKKKAQNHIQMMFYATGIYVAYGIKLKEAYLDWIATEKGLDGVIRPTGHMESFKVTFLLNDLEKMKSLILKVAKEIELAWSIHVPDPKWNW